ncbi:MAG: hypothetical protein OXB88_10520 [Bacteriovoracales bacterium]|nr:hypothetical protein [Bacteriovoracales bacterium]
MKNPRAKKSRHLIAISTFMLLLFSCSSGGSQKSSSLEISKEQYDALLKKYNTLQEELKILRSYERERTRKIAQSSEDVSNRLDKTEGIHTVDVFLEGQNSPGLPQEQEHKKGPSPETITHDDSGDDDEKTLRELIEQLRQAQTLVNQGNYQESKVILKHLQDSPYRQIQVRAKFWMGESLFHQKEFDLALQTYEDIIQKDAFSGFVLKSLERLIVCSEKLKLDRKKDLYYSMLHDFFGGV